MGHHTAVDFTAADDKHIWAQQLESIEIFRLVDDDGAGGAPRAVSGEDDILSLGQGLADRIPGFPPHNDRVAGGVAAKQFEVFGKVPGKSAVFTDGAVGGHGDHGCQAD